LEGILALVTEGEAADGIREPNIIKNLKSKRKNPYQQKKKKKKKKKEEASHL